MTAQKLTARLTPPSHLFLALVAVLMAFASVPTMAQRPAAAQSPSRPAPAPRTLDGHPDLQGVWSFASLTPLERPDELGDKEVLTEKEALQYQQTLVRALTTTPPTAPSAPAKAPETTMSSGTIGAASARRDARR